MFLKLRHILPDINNLTIDILLHGSLSHAIDNNMLLNHIVHGYINDVHRFLLKIFKIILQPDVTTVDVRYMLQIKVSRHS